ncbi:seryl-tRNA synthetase [Candidatus Endolissoclinum faulkneri L2]|uniref:Serine--tRNA ligase n=1 Tax=Candidatus Endolissoclinum faulkneri L2 TaxID=1193729 RepID=K7YHU1_9PROT|nr:serine--tRNA ligase [Candidatus Endolissoclinum faulkneri]AFX99165.1 seryl-tRNA synthetase [Candidatus Endolissoclinum faulkneri L2]
MHDIRSIRKNTATFDKGLIKRGIASSSKAVLAKDSEWRSIITELQIAQRRRNEASRQIYIAKCKGEDVQTIIAEISQIKHDISQLQELERKLATEVNAMLEILPNIPADDVPDGLDESANILMRTVGTPRSFNFLPRDHVMLGEGLGMMDFSLGATLAGSRFVVLKSHLAKLERSIAYFMLDIHTNKFGYTEIVPPFIVRDAAVYGTGQLPKFSDNLFQTTDGHWLIPTAEVPLTNLVADSIVDESELPLRFTAYTPCFRSEAGAAGRDTRGMIRQRQFTKVELVSVVHPENSDDELERMTNCAETILQKLGLAYRVMKLSAGDMGFTARRTYDLEVWLPGQNEGKGQYREISSCSTCGSFQARRMKSRFKAKGEKKTDFVHTLNGSALAIQRTMIAILETYQNEDGSVSVPDVLQPYFGRDLINLVE